MNFIKDLLKEWLGYNSLLDDFEAVRKELLETERNLIMVKDRLNKRTIEKCQEEYWNNRHPKRDISYRRQETNGEYLIDVRSFFMKSSDYPKISGNNYDEIALNCLKWIMKNVKYISDKKVYGFTEYWAMPYQVLKRLKDDCDGGMVLLANIMLYNKIPQWRVRINCGYVNVNGKKIGHAYITYCRESDNQFVVLDWCFYKSYQKIEDRKLHKDKRDYYQIWWSSTSEQSYGSHKYLKSMSEEFKIK